MDDLTFELDAEIRSEDPAALRPVLEQLFRPDEIRPTDRGFEVHALVACDSARDCNRSLLSALRRAVRRTSLRARWSFGGVSERYFDYVLKGRDA